MPRKHTISRPRIQTKSRRTRTPLKRGKPEPRPARPRRRDRDDPNSPPPRRKTNKALNGISLMTGAGGFDIGLGNAGVVIRCAVERDRSCCETLKLNRPNLPVLSRDICDVTAEELLAAADLKKGRVDIMFGGPPCQSFSNAGKGHGFDDERANAFIAFLNLIAGIMPRYALIENVRGLLSKPGPGYPSKGGAMVFVVKYLEALGYHATFALYNAADYGVPQCRNRIIIASLDGPVPLVPPTHAKDDAGGLGRWNTLGDAIDGFDTTDIHATSFSERLMRYLRKLRPGQNWRDLSPKDQRDAMGGAYDSNSGGRSSYFRRLALDKPCPTLLTSPTQKATPFCHPVEDRPLSVEEYAAIQQFSADWRFAGSLASIYRQIGNAVPVGMAEAIGRHIVRWDSMSASARERFAEECASSAQTHPRSCSRERFEALRDETRC